MCSSYKIIMAGKHWYILYSNTCAIHAHCPPLTIFTNILINESHTYTCTCISYMSTCFDCRDWVHSEKWIQSSAYHGSVNVCKNSGLIQIRWRSNWNKKRCIWINVCNGVTLRNNPPIVIYAASTPSHHLGGGGGHYKKYGEQASLLWLKLFSGYYIEHQTLGNL